MQIDQKEKAELVRSSIGNSMDYDAYRSMMEDLTEQGKSSSKEQTEALSNYTKLNTSRMRRLEKTIRVPDDINRKFQDYKGDQTWLVITESWCGDAAQTIPIIKKMAELAPTVDLRFVLRDEHPELMDAFLYKGTRSIPILIAIDNNSDEIITTWGPRPSVANQMVQDFKDAHGGLTDEFKKNLQLWYNKDKGITTMSDLEKFLADH